MCGCVRSVLMVVSEEWGCVRNLCMVGSEEWVCVGV